MAEQKKSSPWVWISLVIIVGIFVTFILFLDQKIVKNGRQTADASPQTPSAATKPVIDFYTVLKERNFVVPEIPQNESISGVDGPLENAVDKYYILQAGSFKEPRDADRRKAELAMLGLEAAIKKAQVEGTDFYRVELGPFSDDGQYSEVKSRLIRNDIQYIAKTHK